MGEKVYIVVGSAGCREWIAGVYTDMDVAISTATRMLRTAKEAGEADDFYISAAPMNIWGVWESFSVTGMPRHWSYEGTLRSHSQGVL